MSQVYKHYLLILVGVR